MEETFEEEILFLLLMRRRRVRLEKVKKRSKHRFWVRSVLKRRQELGEYSHLVQELRNDDKDFLNVPLPFCHTDKSTR